MKNKRGQSTVTKFLGGLIILFVLSIVVTAAFSIFSDGVSAGQAIVNSIGSVTNIVLSVFGPLFNLLLDLDGNPGNEFLMIMTFILTFIVILGTLDSVNIFGEAGKGGLINFLIGLIVTAIGVRFMPANLWESLTAPSSAFVATILVGMPFVAMVFLTAKFKYNALSKGAWIFYILTIFYVIFNPEGQGSFNWVYLTFALLAIIMLFYDAQIRKFFYRERAKLDIEKNLADVNLIERNTIRDEIVELQKIRASSTAASKEKEKAKERIAELKKIYKNIAE